METVFLGCFLFGALFTVASAALGAAAHAGHIPVGGHEGAGHLGHGQVGGGGHGHVGHGGHADAGDSGHGQGGLPLLNLSSVMAFLTWFGAAGFIVLRFTSLPLLGAVAGGAVAGAAGAVLIASFLRQVMKGERVMNRRDYQMEGTLARVSVTIPENGVGEIVYTKGGTRRGEAARGLSGGAIPRDTEVVVIEYAHGIAQVQSYDEFVPRRASGDRGPLSSLEDSSLPPFRST